MVLFMLCLWHAGNTAVIVVVVVIVALLVGVGAFAFCRRREAQATAPHGDFAVLPGEAAPRSSPSKVCVNFHFATPRTCAR